MLIAPFILLGLNSSAQDPTSDLNKKVDKIHRKFLTVDSHNDTPMHLMEAGFDPSKRPKDIASKKQLPYL